MFMTVHDTHDDPVHLLDALSVTLIPLPFAACPRFTGLFRPPRCKADRTLDPGTDKVWYFFIFFAMHAPANSSCYYYHPLYSMSTPCRRCTLAIFFCLPGWACVRHNARNIQPAHRSVRGTRMEISSHDHLVPKPDSSLDRPFKFRSLPQSKHAESRCVVTPLSVEDIPACYKCASILAGYRSVSVRSASKQR